MYPSLADANDGLSDTIFQLQHKTHLPQFCSIVYSRKSDNCTSSTHSLKCKITILTETQDENL